MVEMYCEMSAAMQELVDLQEEIAELEDKKKEKEWSEWKEGILKGKKIRFEKIRIKLGY
jgi:flagellar motility protein MotE (MotC chaperone)